MQIASRARSLLHDLTGSLLNRTRRCTVGVSVGADCYICIRAGIHVFRG